MWFYTVSMQHLVVLARTTSISRTFRHCVCVGEGARGLKGGWGSLIVPWFVVRVRVTNPVSIDPQQTNGAAGELSSAALLMRVWRHSWPLDSSREYNYNGRGKKSN